MESKMLTVRLFVFLLVCSISLENTCRYYTRPTSSCPKNKTEWDKRTTDFPCLNPGRAYTCIILRDSQGNEPDYLVETCINIAYRIADGFPGCPFIIDCDKDGPLIGSEFKFIPCLETLPGCPPKYHGGYTITDLYKYQACLKLNETDMKPSPSEVSDTLSTEGTMRSVTQNKLKTVHIPNSTRRRPYPDDAQKGDAAENRLIEIIVPVTLAVVLMFVVIVIFILCRRKNQSRQMHMRTPFVGRSGKYRDEEEIPMISKRKYTDEKVSQLQQKLLEINIEETQRVVLAPLHHFITEPLEMIYAPVSIRKDLEETLRKSHIVEGSRPKSQPVNGPEDIFDKNGKPTRYVMMQGEAGRGKTVYCLKLLKDWCNVKQQHTKEKDLSDWEKYMDRFDLLLLVKLRHVKESTMSLLDMICDDLEAKGLFGFKDTVRAVLDSDEYKCLIIIDGLDEWKAQDNVSSEIQSPGIPNLKGISCSTFFFTMRPWKFDAVVDLIGPNDRVIEIQGLNEKGIEILIKNLLLNHFELKLHSFEYNKWLSKLRKKAANETVKSLLQIPLVAVVTILLWFRKEKVRNYLTTFYLAIIRMLVARAIKNESVDKSLIDACKSWDESKQTLNVPSLIMNDKTLCDVFGILYKLGEVAFNDLNRKHSRLLFEEKEITKQIGEKELEFALKTGILTKSEKIQSVCDEQTCPCVSFFHKTVQELLTAVYVSSTEEASQLFLEHLSSLETILEFENVNVFVSGLYPSLGETLSQHIVNVANKDPDILRYRVVFHLKLQNKVELLYKMQLSCLRELQLSGEDKSKTTQQYNFQISDIYVNDSSDRHTVRLTSDVLRNYNSKVVSLFARRVLNDMQNGIDDGVFNDYLQQTATLTSLLIDGSNNNRTLYTINNLSSLKTLVLYNLSITPSLLHDIQTSLHNNTQIHTLGLMFLKCVDSGEVRNDSSKTMTTSFRGLLQNLPSCKHLSEFNISYLKNKDERDMLVNVLPDLSHLTVIWYFGSTFGSTDGVDGGYDCTIVHTVSQWEQIQVLVLGYITLGERSLELTADMDHLGEVWLIRIKMSAGSWSKFITSLENIEHQFDVRLYDTDISANCLSKVCSSPHFTVTYMYTDKGQSWLFFIRKYPPTFQSQGAQS